MFPHSTILGPLFWIIMGVLYSFMFYGAKLWFEDLKIKMTKRKWALVLSFFLFVNTTIGGGATLIGEDEHRAGTYFIGIGTVICTILGVGLWRYLISSRVKD
jgi:hypothetical protein